MQGKVPITASDSVVIEGKEFKAKYPASVVQALWDDAMRFIDQEAIKLQAEYPLPSATQAELVKQTKDAFWSQGFESFLHHMDEILAFHIPAYQIHLRDWLEEHTFVSMRETWREVFLESQSPVPSPSTIAETRLGGKE